MSQKRDSTWTGSVTGVVKDSAYNYVLQSASVAVYSKDTSLLNYLLCDASGIFHFKELPAGQPLVLRVFYTGYRSYTMKFTIGSREKKLDIGQILLVRDQSELQEVIVKTIAPVRMNGDTLEFNANAFNLDKNAVGEDLLRRLPGVTVWSDGSITVNGRPVSKVLVDGRPFFGNDLRIATQNISKSAIDKIQVYHNLNINNPLDSITNINVKLKKDRNFGFFGKAGAGAGTDERYVAEANINFFRPRTQLGFAGIGNNINKVAADATTLLKNSTFKGTGATTEYQTDFRMPGRNLTKSAGIVFQHDFLNSVNPDKKDLLSGNCFFTDNQNNTTKKLLTVTSLPNDSLQYLNSNTSVISSNNANRLDATYNKKRMNDELDIKTIIETTLNKSSSTQQTFLTDRFDSFRSASNTDISSSGSFNKLGVDGRYVKRKSPYSVTRKPGDIEIAYAINHETFTTDLLNKTDFVSLIDASQNRTFDRKYHSNGQDTKQSLLTSIGNLSKWIFGYRNKIMSGLDIKLQNHIVLENHSKTDNVSDLDTTSNIYVPNKNLSVEGRYNIINENLRLNLSRNISRTFASRYQKTLLTTIQIQQQLYNLNSVSTQPVQNISYNYLKFIPVIEINYSNYQFGEYQDIYNAKFNITADYPTVAQLAPLVDSLNLYYVIHGNIHLKPSDRKELSFSWNHISFRMKNSFLYYVELNAGITNNSFADSSITDSLGRTAIYTVNADGKKYLKLSGKLNKALKLGKNNQLQFAVAPAIGFERTPNNINGIWNFSNSFSFLNVLDISYTYKDFFAANFKQTLYHYSSTQQVLKSKSISNDLHITSVSLSCNPFSKLNVASNINFNYNRSTSQKPSRFTIWNINAGYRFLSDNSIELRLSALDLLHQNKGIITYGSGNSVTNGSTNVLQQYFMATLSYFPRKFGKSK